MICMNSALAILNELRIIDSRLGNNIPDLSSVIKETQNTVSNLTLPMFRDMIREKLGINIPDHEFAVNGSRYFLNTQPYKNGTVSLVFNLMTNDYVVTFNNWNGGINLESSDLNAILDTIDDSAEVLAEY